MVKIFSHQADPDGIGCVILAFKAFENADYVLCKNKTELNEKLQSFLKSNEASNYDQIFITDLVPSLEILKQIAQNEDVAKKVEVIDHHFSNLEMVKNYNFPFVKISLEGCATSLYYEYLKKTNKLTQTPCLTEFVNLTRLHDTWGWKEEQNFDAYYLETLFHKLGAFGYLKHFLEHLNLEQEHFQYSAEERNWIKEQKELEEQYVKGLLSRVCFKTVDNITYVIVYGLYDYRNILAERLEEEQKGDVLIFMAVDNETISFRSINKQTPVNELATSYGGGGHLHAAACHLTKENELKLIKKYMI